MSAHTGPESPGAAPPGMESNAPRSTADGASQPQQSASERLRRAADLIEQTAATTRGYPDDPWAGHIRDTLVPWVALMSPELAGPLAALLRDAADVYDACAPGWVRALAVADVILGAGAP